MYRTVIVRRIMGTVATLEDETTPETWEVDLGAEIEACELGERIALPEARLRSDVSIAAFGADLADCCR